MEISEERLAGNYGVLTRAAGGDVAVMGVVKANAYGHGAALCVPVLTRAGAEWLGVADAVEGATARAALLAAGMDRARQPRIMTMSGMLDDDADMMVEHDLTPVVWNLRQMELLAVAVRRRGSAALRVHLEMDSGMTRQGVRAEGLPEVLGWLTAQKELVLDGVMTHFASAEVAGAEQTRRQRERFGEAVRTVRDAGLRPQWVHAGASSTVDNDVQEGSLC
ncbi:alanine racemase, partial [Edaphobacter sp.]|uniref:alanine racemase n=1 Tax=Edaphobacter sp. TaxID=1934404 RepID=UPI002DBCE0A7